MARLVIGLAVVAVVVAVVLYFHERSQVGSIQARLDEAEPGWRMDDLWADYQRVLPRDDRNSFRVVDAASRAIPQPFITWSQKPESLVSAVRDAEVDLTTRVPARTAEECRVQLKAAQPALDIAHTLRSFTGPGRAPTTLAVDGIGTLLPHIDTVHKVCDLLEAEGTFAARTYDPDRALLAAICTVQAGRSIGDEPFFVSQLMRKRGSTSAVRIAERALARNAGREERLAELQDRLAAEVDPSRFLLTMKMDRACLNQIFDNLRTGKDTIRSLTARYGLNVPGSVELQSVLFTMQENGDQRAVLGFSNQLVEMARLPEEQRVGRARQIPPLAERQSVIFKLLTGLTGAGATPSKLVELDLLAVAHARCGIAAVACERFRLRTGAWPKSLEELPKDLLPVAVTDPFTGGPLRFKLDDGGAVVYSVGPDGEDNGGRLAYSRAIPPGHDIGFRLVDPQKRNPE